MVKVFILLGGLIGLDGYAVSPGILFLAHKLEPFADVTTYNWTAQREVPRQIANLNPRDMGGLIGDSGGGSPTTQVAQELNGKAPHKIALLLAHDLSPSCSMAA